MSLSLLLSIPGDVLRDKISPFFDFLSLVRLDSAVQSEEHRPLLLSNILHNATLTCEVCYNVGMANWLIKRCVNVTSLRFLPNVEPSDAVLATSIMSRATLVDMDACNNLTNESVQYMLRNCGSKSLTVLGCENCEWLNDETLKVLADNHNHSLSGFFLSSSPCVTDAGAAYLLSKCPRISKVQWRDCEQIGARAVAAIANHSMETFCAVNCPAIPEASLVNFLQNNNDCLRNFALVNIEETTDLTLLALARHCPSVDSVAINNSEGSSAALCGLIKSCQKLNELSANDCNVTSTVLDCMGQHLNPTLTALSIVGCAPLKPAQFSAITRRVPMLKTLSIGSNEGLGDDCLVDIGANCAHLESLSVEMCAEITLVGIHALVNNCPQLAELTITMCHNVCDECLVLIAKNCLNLRQLNVSDNPNITDRGLGAFSRFNAKLEILGLGYTNVTEKGVVRLINTCPALRTVEMQGQEDNVSHVLLDAAKRYNVTLITEDEDEQSNDIEDLLHMYGGGAQWQ